MSLFNQTVKNSLKWQSARAALNKIRDDTLSETCGDLYHDTLHHSRYIDGLVKRAEITQDVGDYMKENYFVIGHKSAVEYEFADLAPMRIWMTNEEKPYYDAAAFQMITNLHIFLQEHSLKRGHISSTATWKKICDSEAILFRGWIFDTIEKCVREKVKCEKVPAAFSCMLQFSYKYDTFTSIRDDDGMTRFYIETNDFYKDFYPDNAVEGHLSDSDEY